MPAMRTPVNVFMSSSGSSRDEPLRAELEKHLAALNRQGLISVWHNRLIAAGDDWRSAIDEHLESAAIVILLVSADLLASDYCYDVEIARALARHAAGETRVFPIILRACDWRTTPFGRLRVLPLDGRAVTSWKNHDEAWESIALAIRAAVESGAPPAARSASSQHAVQPGEALGGPKPSGGSTTGTLGVATWVALVVYILSFACPAAQARDHVFVGYEAAYTFSVLLIADVSSIKDAFLFLLLAPHNLVIISAFVLMLLKRGIRLAPPLAIYGFVGQASFLFVYGSEVKHFSIGYWLWVLSGLSISVLATMRQSSLK
jgi:hypothetical protein